MQQRSLPCLGIDFAEDKIRLAKLQFAPFPYLESVEEILLPGYMDEDCMIADPKQIGSILKRHADRHERNCRTVFSIPNEKSSFNWYRFQGMEGRELRDAARYRVRRGDEEAETIAIALCPTRDDEHLVVSSPQAILQQRKDLLERAGFQVSGAETNAQAVLRSVARATEYQDDVVSTSSVTIAHITESRTHIMVVQNGRLTFVRSSRIGYSGLVAKAAEVLAVSPEVAMPVLFNASTRMRESFDANVVYDGCDYLLDMREPMNAFVKEFRRVQNYFRSLHPERSFAGVINRIIIAGLPALATGFSQALGSSLGIRIERHLPSWKIPMITGEASFSAMRTRPPSFVVPIGLALAPYGDAIDNTQQEEEFVWNIRNAS